jgi:hypothetical protein
MAGPPPGATHGSSPQSLRRAVIIQREYRLESGRKLLRRQRMMLMHHAPPPTNFAQTHRQSKF